jgi:syntaxin 1B/2/3
VVSARAARKKRWICFFIILAVVAVVAIILAIVLTKQFANNKNSNST